MNRIWIRIDLQLVMSTRYSNIQMLGHLFHKAWAYRVLHRRGRRRGLIKSALGFCNRQWNLLETQHYIYIFRNENEALPDMNRLRLM